MKSDTWINVGAVIGMGTLLVTVMVFQGASTNARIDDVSAHVERLDTRIDGLGTRIDGLDTRFDRLDTRIDDLRSDMREDHAAIQVRLDALQEGQSEIGQRLSHVEGRLGLPRSVGEEATPR